MQGIYEIDGIFTNIPTVYIGLIYLIKGKFL